MRHTILLGFFLLVASPAMPQSAPAAPDYGVTTYKLKNGMKILVQEDHSIPSVALYIFYRIGSRNERPGTTGLSHFFEHMMFNGAKKYGPKMFDQTLEAAGGSNNAYTTNDMTVYQDWFPPSTLETVFDLEADRMQNLNFDEKIIESERGVVYSERRSSVDASNFGLLSEQLEATAFTAHPYQWPVVGWAVDIENWTMEDLRHHYAIGYSPANATMVVTGDVKPEEVYALAQKSIEPIPSRGLPPPVTTEEPEQLGERRVTVHKFAQLPILMAGWHVPEAADADFYALQLLSTVLFDGESSRMYQRLVDKDQLVTSIDGYYGFTFDPTLFEVFAEPRQDVSTDRVEKAMYEELDRLKTSLVSDQELDKAKNIQLAGFYRRLKTINGKANALGQYENFFGDYRKMFTAPDEYNKVTKEDIQRVAKKYFNENNRTVAILIPEKEQ
jgi:zinc protease